MDKAKVVNIKGRQVVRLPPKYRFETNEVYVRRDPANGDVILSTVNKSWDAFIALRDESDPDVQTFMSDRKDEPP